MELEGVTVKFVEADVSDVDASLFRRDLPVVIDTVVFLLFNVSI